jgi:hypothetical protein
MNYIYVHHDDEPNLNHMEETNHGISTLDPYRDMMSVRDEMNRVLNEVFSRGSNDESAWFSGAWTPRSISMKLMTRWS